MLFRASNGHDLLSFCGRASGHNLLGAVTQPGAERERERERGRERKREEERGRERGREREREEGREREREHDTSRFEDTELPRRPQPVPTLPDPPRIP